MSVSFKTSILKICTALLFISTYSVNAMILKHNTPQYSHYSHRHRRHSHNNRYHKRVRKLSIANYHPPKLLTALSGFMSGVITNVNTERKLAKEVNPSLSMSLDKGRSLYTKIYNYNRDNFNIKSNRGDVKALFVNAFTEGQKYSLANDDARELLRRDFDKGVMKDVLGDLGFQRLSAKDRLLVDKIMKDIRRKKRDIEDLSEN